MAVRQRYLRVAGIGLVLLAALPGYAVEILCPADIVRGTTPGACGAVVTYRPRISGGVLVVSCLPASGSFFPKGDTAVTCRAGSTPPLGGTASCGFTVTVEDGEAPLPVCPASADVTLPSGRCKVAAVYPELSPASDNCPAIGRPEFDPPAGTMLSVGTSTVTVTVADAAGNHGTCQFPFDVKFPNGVDCDDDRCTDDGCSDDGACTFAERPPTQPDAVLCNVDNLREHLTAQPAPACVAKCFATLDHRLTKLSTLLSDAGNVSPKKCRRRLGAVLRGAKALSKALGHLAATGKLDPTDRAERVQAEAAALVARDTALANSLFCIAH